VSVIDADSGAVVPDNATQPFPNAGEIALDHAAQAAGRVLWQYQNSPKLQGLIAGLAALAQRIENCLVSIAALDDPAVATGNASDPVGQPGPLDVTGELVGQSRVLSDGTVVDDATFRAYIALRILRNSSIASSPEYVAALTAIFGATSFRYMDFGGMAVGIELGTGAAPSNDIIALIDRDTGLAPVAMGVGVGREWYDPAEWFAFNEDAGTGAKGFGEIGDPTQGGDFAELF
jgi:hypothetical protein